jgi:hypothetical protein
LRLSLIAMIWPPLQDTTGRLGAARRGDLLGQARAVARPPGSYSVPTTVEISGSETCRR